MPSVDHRNLGGLPAGSSSSSWSPFVVVPLVRGTHRLGYAILDPLSRTELGFGGLSAAGRRLCGHGRAGGDVRRSARGGGRRRRSLGHAGALIDGSGSDGASARAGEECVLAALECALLVSVTSLFVSVQLVPDEVVEDGCATRVGLRGGDRAGGMSDRDRRSGSSGRGCVCAL